MEKTIAAISTAVSASGIGIVRISGEESMDVSAKRHLILFIMDIFMMERNW